MPPLTIIIPTYNERENISRILFAVRQALPAAHILVVDDSSPDGTGDVVRTCMAAMPNIGLLERPKKEGLGRAYEAAFERVLSDTSTEIIVMMDADFSHDPVDIVRLVAALDSVDVSIGSRYVRGGATTNWELWRRCLSRWGNWYVRMVTRLPIHDCTSGFVAIRTPLLHAIDRQIFQASGYAFQIELKYWLWRHGARFDEVPIVFKNREYGVSKISKHIIREGLIMPWRMRALSYEVIDENKK